MLNTSASWKLGQRPNTLHDFVAAFKVRRVAHRLFG
jgi:hypothetical protein